MEKKLIMSLIFAIVTLPYWCLVVVDFAFDLHLTYYTFGVFIKSFFPIALILNIVGILLGVKRLFVSHTAGEPITILALVLNALPLLSIIAILIWWLFIFRM